MLQPSEVLLMIQTIETLRGRINSAVFEGHDIMHLQAFLSAVGKFEGAANEAAGKVAALAARPVSTARERQWPVHGLYLVPAREHPRDLRVDFRSS